MINKMDAGSIEFITGVMNSEKSFVLLKRIHDALLDEKSCLVLKPSTDTRDGAEVKSRKAVRTRPAVLVDESNVQVVNLIFNALGNYDVVFIDEVQFFSHDFVMRLINKALAGKIAIVASGLTNDFRQQEFEASRLMRIYATEEIDFRTGVCYFCKEEHREVLDTSTFEGTFYIKGAYEKHATVNARLDANDNIITEGNIVSIEGSDTTYHYETVCRHCFNTRK